MVLFSVCLFLNLLNILWFLSCSEIAFQNYHSKFHHEEKKKKETLGVPCFLYLKQVFTGL